MYDRFSHKRKCLIDYLNYVNSSVLNFKYSGKSAIRIIWKFRIGNGLLALLNALLFCKITGIRHIIIPSNFMRLVFSNFQSTDGIEIHIWNDSLSEKFETIFTGKHTFYPYPGRTPFCPDWNFNEFASTVRNQLLKFIPISKIDNETLILNIRSGDIFKNNIHRHYSQPPCFFYTDLLHDFKNAEILTSDKGNPCVDVAIQAGAKFPGLNLGTDDLSRMIYAKYLVLARSSYSRAALYLSPIKKIFLGF